MADEHSKLFPFSSAHRWAGTACPGSVVLNLTEPDEETEQSREGTAAHWVLQVMLESFKRKVSDDIDCGVDDGRRLIGVSHPTNKVIITEEMFDAAVGLYRIVTPVVEHKDALVVEYRVHAPSIHAEAWGTLDVAYYDAKAHRVHVWDLKFGHRRVLAYRNYQLIGYAQALCETWRMGGNNPRLQLGIYQPRCYDGKGPLDVWATTLDDIRAYVNHLRGGCELYDSGNAKLVPGVWCRDCQPRYRCPADLNASAEAIDISFTPMETRATDAALAYELTLLTAASERLSKRLVALEAEAVRRITTGHLVPGYRMQDTFGRDTWTVGAEDVISMCDLFGVDARKPQDVKTPSQVNALLKKAGVDGSVIQPYHGSSKSGIKLVQDDGTRAQQIFSQENSND